LAPRLSARDTKSGKKRLHPVAIGLGNKMRDQARLIADEQGRWMVNLIIFSIERRTSERTRTVDLRAWLADYKHIEKINRCRLRQRVAKSAHVPGGWI